MSSDIVILDDVFDKDSFPNIQSDLISKLNGTSLEEYWYLLNTNHKFKQFCLKLINIAADYFDLSSCSGYENWWHVNTKPPAWHIDCDERRKLEDNCMTFPLCSIVYYIKVDNLVKGRLHISHNDDVKSGDTYQKFDQIRDSHPDNPDNNFSSDVIYPKTNRMVIFSPGKFHTVEQFSGTRILMVINPWDASKYKYSTLKEGYDLIYDGSNTHHFEKNE